MKVKANLISGKYRKLNTEKNESKISAWKVRLIFAVMSQIRCGIGSGVECGASSLVRRMIIEYKRSI